MEQPLDNQKQTSEQIKVFREAMGITDPKDKHQAHGHTVREMEDLKTEQSAGNVETITANMEPSLKIKKCDAHLVHAVIENYETDRKGKRISVPRTQCFSIVDFDRMTHPNPKISGNVFAGCNVDIIHDPRKKVAASDISGAEANNKNAGSETKATKKGLTVEALPKINERELRKIYENMFGEPAKKEETADTLRTAIAEKLNEAK